MSWASGVVQALCSGLCRLCRLALGFGFRVTHRLVPFWDYLAGFE